MDLRVLETTLRGLEGSEGGFRKEFIMHIAPGIKYDVEKIFKLFPNLNIKYTVCHYPIIVTGRELNYHDDWVLTEFCYGERVNSGN